MTAASALSKLEVGNILLLEAKPTLGGRLESVEFAGAAANVGANWIHHMVGNPITHLARKHGCRYETTSNANTKYATVCCLEVSYVVG